MSTATKTNRARPAPAQFPATRRPQRVQRIMRVRNIDTGEQGTVLGRRGHGAGSFLKVKWDNRTKLSLIKPDQLRQVRNSAARASRNGSVSTGSGSDRGKKKHQFAFRILINPSKKNVDLVGAAATLQAAEYLEKEFKQANRKKKRNPPRIPTNEFGLHSTKSGRYPQQGLHSSLSRRLEAAERSGRISAAESDHLFALMIKAWPMITENTPEQRRLRAKTKAEFDRVLGKKKKRNGKENPMSLLEVGSHSAVILSGLVTASQMLKRKPAKNKARRPTVTAAGKRLAQRRHGSVKGGTKTIRRKVNGMELSNPRARAKALGVIERRPGLSTHEISDVLGWGSGNETRLRDQLLNLEKKKGEIYSVAKFGKHGGTKERRWYPVAKNAGYLDEEGRFRPIRGTAGADHYPRTHMGGMKASHASARDKEYRRLRSSKGQRAADAFLKKTALKKRRNPQPETSNLKPSNALQKIHSDFLGKPMSGRAKQLYVAPGQPLKNASLAPMIKIEMENGSAQKFPKGFAWLGGTEHGNGRRHTTRRLRIGLKQPFPIPNGVNPDRAVSLGEVKKLWYDATKKHLYPHLNEIRFHHTMGEEGGARPELMMQNGCLFFRGGDYEILREGIAN